MDIDYREPRMNYLLKTSTILVGVVLLLRALLRSNLIILRNQLPSHLLHQPVHVQRNLLTPKVGKELLQLVESIGTKNGYPTNVVDTSFYHTEHEHVGEAVPAVTEADGSVICENPFLVPSVNRTLCLLAGRIDIGRHLILTGGARGLREPYAKIISRVQSFGAYHFDLNAYPVVSRLFQEKEFLNTALKVCPANKRHLDPFQFNFIIQVPGQTVATHIDGVYFKGASRFQFPQWLLAAMKFSGLWEDEFVDQVQVVGYLHQWQPKEDEEETKTTKVKVVQESSMDTDQYGSFVYWNDENPIPKRVLPFPLSGNVVDGSKVVHAASVYRKDADIPTIDKSIANWLKKVKDEKDRWTLSNDRDGVFKNYTLNDLRISIVYRARCFTTAEEAQQFREQLHGEGGKDGRFTLEEILNRFLNDLIQKGYYSKGTTLSMIPRLELAMKILKVYIKYPLPSTPTIPYNYCAASKLIPWLKGPLSLIC